MVHTMSRVPELIQAVQALPTLTQACEHLVHTIGWPPDAVASKLAVPLDQVRLHLEAARAARHALAMEREANPVQPRDEAERALAAETRQAAHRARLAEAPLQSAAEAREARDADIVRMRLDGMRPSQIAVREGLTASSVSVVLAEHRARGIPIPVGKPGRIAGGRNRRA